MNNNVLIKTMNLQDLENDYYRWASLPYTIRQRSDEECMRLYECTNGELYEKQRSQIISMDLMIDEDTDNNGMSKEDKGMQQRKQVARSLNQSPSTEILIPGSYLRFEDLSKAYQRYLNTSYNDRIMSDEYSRQLFGLSVQDVYRQCRQKFIDQADQARHESYEYSEFYYRIHSIEEDFKPVKNYIGHMVANDDKVGLLLNKLDKYMDHPRLYNYLYENRDIDYKVAFESEIELEEIANYVPYFTPTEMFCMEENITQYSYGEWKKKLLEAVHSVDEDEMMKLGWNPGVAFTKSNITHARKRQRDWLESHMPTIVDITNISNRFELLDESTKAMKKYYAKKNLYPIYIICSFTNTIAGNLIKHVKHSEYTHAGISLDSDLKEIFTFNFDSLGEQGFKKESLDTYMNNSKGKAQIDVLAVFVNKKTRDRIEEAIKVFEKYRKKTTYGFKNWINMLFNLESRRKNNLDLVCSQFVDLILKLAHIDLFTIPNNLVLPQDFVDLADKTKVKIFKIYEGLGKDYDDIIAEKNITALFAKKNPSDIRYNNKEKLDTEAIKDILGFKETYDQLMELLTPTDIITERFIPLRISDNGDLHIEYKKDMEEQYQESHKLLTSYSKAKGYDGMKQELAHLFALNSDIERTIKKMKKNDESYKELVDLRARIINDFKKYMKEVLKADPGFDFGKYFKDSEYYNGSVSIHSSTLKYSGSLIRSFLKAQGL